MASDSTVNISEPKNEINSQHEKIRGNRKLKVLPFTLAVIILVVLAYFYYNIFINKYYGTKQAAIRSRCVTKLSELIKIQDDYYTGSGNSDYGNWVDLQNNNYLKPEDTKENYIPE